MTQPTDSLSIQGTNEVDLVDLMLVLWRLKWLTVACTVLFLSAGVVFSLSQPNMYRAVAILAPTESSPNMVSSALGSYGGLANLAGVSLPMGKGALRSDIALKVLTSYAFINDFIDRRNLSPILFAVRDWDKDDGGLVFNSDMVDVSGQTWVGGEAAKPSRQQQHIAFVNALSVSQDKQSVFVTLGFEHVSPVVAAQVVEWLVLDLNENIKRQEVDEAERSISYLRKQVQSTPLADLRAVFFELIESQTETIMLAEVRPEYVFRTVDPAVVPEIKSAPKRAIICVLSAFAGLLFGVLASFGLHFYPKLKDKLQASE